MLAEPLAPDTGVNPVVLDRFNVPWATLSVSCSVPPLASTSDRLIALAPLKTIGVLALVTCAPGAPLTGASLTAAMLIVELVVTLNGPLPVLPLSLMLSMSVSVDGGVSEL